MKPRPKNIVLIVADDLGYGDLGCMGSNLNSTPNLDRMAAEGTTFDNFYMASSVCSPSRAALMTGCYPRRVGLQTGENFCVLLPGDSIGLRPGETTLATALKDRGYATKIIGKWHLGDQPEFMPDKHGFDEYFGLPYSNDMHPSHPGNDRHQFPPLMLMRDEQIVEVESPEDLDAVADFQSKLTARYVAESIRFIDQHRDEPFFLYLPHMYVHTPHYAPREYLDRSTNGAYGAVVEHLDWSVGEILNALDERGLGENTLVLFTSDNGANTRSGSNAPLRGGKGSTFEGGFRLPLIVRMPGTVPAGRICSELVCSMDFLPTFSALAGEGPAPAAPIDGKDITPLLLGKPDTASLHEAYFYYKGGSLDAVRSLKWKLFVESGELYDLNTDVGETTDVAADHPDVTARLRALAEECRKDIGDDRTGAAGVNCRPAGKVDHPKTILPRHPLAGAEYD